MGKRGPKPKEKQETEDSATPVPVEVAISTDTPEEKTETPVIQETPVIAQFRSCLYHEHEEPRMFENGDVIPKGWVDSQKTLTRFWVVVGGEWKRKDKE